MGSLLDSLISIQCFTRRFIRRKQVSDAKPAPVQTYKLLALRIHFFLVLCLCLKSLFSASTLFAALGVLLDVSFIIEVYGENAFFGPRGGKNDLQS